MSGHERSVRSRDGVEIAFDVTGQGRPALVFVHGWSGRRGHWDGQVDSFAPRHTVVRIDLAGHGASGTERTRWSVEAFADDVIAVVDSLTLERSVLVGHSLGGSVIALASRRLGTRVAALIGIDTWSAIGVRLPPETIGQSIKLPEMRADFAVGSRLFAEMMCGPTAGPSLTARIIEEVASMSPTIAVAILDDAIREGPDEIESSLRDCAAPKSAISSETFRPKDPATLASFGIHNVVIPGTGHYLMLEQTSIFNAQLREAIARSTAG